MPNSEVCPNGVISRFEDAAALLTRGQGKSVDDQIYEIPKSKLLDHSGQSYYEFKRKLTPRYFVVWRDIIAGYAALSIVALGLLAVQTAPWWVVIPSLLLGALF